ncbi:protein-glutamate O-methyltransferase CheR [bacterium]|nr:protein-glutamate O-methyltransferase CheR [bacterium]
MGLETNHFPLDDNTYRQLTDLIHNCSGLRFDPSAKFMIQRRLEPRLLSLQLDSFEKYYYYLRYDPNRETEMDVIFDLITTHETYFFREEPQLLAFTNEIIPQLMEARKQFRTIRIWCAGCSSGEEPYTVAILCRQLPELQNWNVEIFASDISQKMIHAARRGIYGENSFRSTKNLVKCVYFDKTNENQYRIHDEIKQMVTFMKLNLLDDRRVGVFGEMDVIFCRNVIIYFDREAKKKIVENFFHKLRQGGYLLLGHSESLLNLTTSFKLRHLTNDMVYQK